MLSKWNANIQCVYDIFIYTLLSIVYSHKKWYLHKQRNDKNAIFLAQGVLHAVE